jgi:outer membrane protein OmpT
MFKKVAVVVLALAAMSANAVSLVKSDTASVDLYGQLRAQYEDTVADNKEATLNAGSSRLGVKGNYVVNDDVKVIGLVEFGVSFKDGSKYNMENRLHYMGFETNLGTLTFGRQWTVADQLWSAKGVDPTYFFGGKGINHGKLNGARHDSMVKYTWSDDVFGIYANHGINENDSQMSVSELYGTITMGGTMTLVGIGQSIDDNHKLGTKTSKVTVSGIDADGKPATTVVTTTSDIKGKVTHTYGVAGIGHSFTDKLDLGVQYNYSDLEYAYGTLREDAVTVGGTFAITDAVTLYGGYDYISADALSLSADQGNAYAGVVWHIVPKTVRVMAEVAQANGDSIDAGTTAFTKSAVADDVQYALGMRVYF